MEISNEAIAKLAEVFGTTTDKIIENVPIFLSKYGWYRTIKDSFTIPLTATFIPFVGLLIMYLIGIKPKEMQKITIILYIISFVFLLVINYVPLFIAPELVGIEYLLSK